MVGMNGDVRMTYPDQEMNSFLPIMTKTMAIMAITIPMKNPMDTTDMAERKRVAWNRFA